MTVSRREFCTGLFGGLFAKKTGDEVLVFRPDASKMQVTASGSTTSRTLGARFAEVVNVRDFGAKGDGETDDTAAVAAAIAQANIVHKPVVFGSFKRYKLTGGDISFSYGAYFNGSTLDISEMSGIVFLNSPGVGWETDAQALELLLEEEDNIPANSVYISEWNTYDEIANHYVHIYTDQYFFTYRGRDTNRDEINFCTDRGSLLSEIKYALPKSNITKVKKMKFNRVPTEYNGVVFYPGDRLNSATGWSGFVITRNSSNVRIKNLSFDLIPNNTISSDAGFSLYRVESSGNVEIDGLYALNPIRKANLTASYDFSIANSYDVKIKNAIGQGSGWGAVGNNNSWRITFEDCDFSRIDFHRPFHEYLKIYNCSVGAWGVSVTAIGDLIVENTIFYNAPMESDATGRAGIIRSRGEASGFCIGNAVVRNCTVYNAYGNCRMFYHTDNNVDQIKSESPLIPVFWENIRVDNLNVVRVSNGGNFILTPYYGNAVSSNSIIYNGVNGNVRWFNNKTEGSYAGIYNYNYCCRQAVELNDIQKMIEFSDIRVIHTYGNGQNGFVKLTLRNVKNGYTGLPFTVSGVFSVNAYNCYFESINNQIYRGSSNQSYLFSNTESVYRNCIIRPRDNVSAPIVILPSRNKSAPHPIFDGCTFFMPMDASVLCSRNNVYLDDDSGETLFDSSFAYAVYKNNHTITVVDSVRQEIKLAEYSNNESSIELTLPSNFCYENMLYIILGTTSNEHCVKFGIYGKNSVNKYYVGPNDAYITVTADYGNNKITVIPSDPTNLPVRKISMAI